MKITINRETLAQATQKCAMAIPSKAMLPCFEMMLLSYKDKFLTITATDGNTDIVAFIPASGKEEGDFCIPGKLFAHTINTLRDDKVDLVLKDKKVTLKTASGKYTFSVLEKEEYVDVKDVSPDFTVTISASFLKRGSRVSASFVKEEDLVRPAFAGVNMYCKRDRLYMQGTNGNCVGRVALPIVTGTDWGNIVVPKSFLPLCSTIFQEGEILFSFSKNRVKASCDGVRVCCTLVDATFPDIEEFLKKKAKEVSFHVPRAALAESLKRLKPFLDDIVPIVKVDAEAAVTMQAAGPSNEAQETLDEAEIKNEMKRPFFVRHDYLAKSANNDETMYMSFYEDSAISFVFIEAKDSDIAECYLVSKTMEE